VDWIEEHFKEFTGSFNWFIRNKWDMIKDVVHKVERDGKTTYILTIVNEEQVQRLLQRMWDEREFLSPYGVGSLSKAHEHPHEFWFEGRCVGYEPAEAVCKIKGGNSNWRGPIWFPTSFLLIESLRKLRKAYGPEYGIPAAGGNGKALTFRAMGHELADRMIRIFTRDQGTKQRPVYGGRPQFHAGPPPHDHL